MDTLLRQLIEAAKQNRKGFRFLKNAAIICQQYELVALLRDIERESFAETQEVLQIKKEARNLANAFKMVDLRVSDELAYLISETIKKHNEKKGEFTVDDGIGLVEKKEKIFITDKD